MIHKITTNTHIIVSDFIHLRNGRYVADNRYNFNFGESRFMSLKLAIDHVMSVLTISNSCLIGHNIKSDLEFLKKVSVKTIDLPIFDTQIIYKQATLNENMLGLVKVLDEIGFVHSNLHNAGNDAHYTLQVFRHLSQV